MVVTSTYTTIILVNYFTIVFFALSLTIFFFLNGGSQDVCVCLSKLIISLKVFPLPLWQLTPAKDRDVSFQNLCMFLKFSQPMSSVDLVPAGKEFQTHPVR
jgi:hypothetical protein